MSARLPLTAVFSTAQAPTEAGYRLRCQARPERMFLFVSATFILFSNFFFGGGFRSVIPFVRLSESATSCFPGELGTRVAAAVVRMRWC